ncbi:MAG: molecular chaperone DnaJ [Proteobacteria bacterium]|nr:MAG: molecular chaperone DnaJ [Pseudomonadota bacterium]
MLYGVAAVLLILVLTGRIHWLFALAGAAVPWLQRAMMAMRAWNSFKAFRGPARGQQSNVSTAYLSMSLDHDSGDIDGEVIAGRFEGARLSSLSLEQLLELLDECRAADPQSVALLEAFLDRRHGAGWRVGRESEDAPPPGPGGSMSVDDALSVLGLETGASIKDVQSAHRRLMQKLHPDRGGSAYFASLINKARDVLLDHARKGT